MKVQKTASAADQGTGDGGVQGDAVNNDTQVQADAAPVETSPAEPDIALEYPSSGGSYIRQADGTLVKQEG